MQRIFIQTTRISYEPITLSFKALHLAHLVSSSICKPFISVAPIKNDDKICIVKIKHLTLQRFQVYIIAKVLKSQANKNCFR